MLLAGCEGEGGDATDGAVPGSGAASNACLQDSGDHIIDLAIQAGTDGFGSDRFRAYGKLLFRQQQHAEGSLQERCRSRKPGSAARRARKGFQLLNWSNDDKIRGVVPTDGPAPLHREASSLAGLDKMGDLNDCSKESGNLIVHTSD